MSVHPTRLLIAMTLLAVSGCKGGAQDPPPTQSPRIEQPSSTPAIPDDGFHCDPLPQPGEPCDPDQGYCVIDWGEPCGWSEALWCVDGKWVIEQEKNLCEDEP